MKNTTERILANDRGVDGCYRWHKAIHKNNPMSAEHWCACITNNPGGNIPNLNPEAWEEEWGLLVSKLHEMDNR